MIALRRAGERRHDRRRNQEVWLTFDPEDASDPLAGGFGALELLNEDRLPPGAGVRRAPHHDAEIITYVREGAVVYEDSLGRTGIIHAGEFQRMTIGPGVRHSAANASRTASAHVFQIGLHPTDSGLEPEQEQKRFSTAERRGILCVVASPDARRGSLRIHQDTVICSAILNPGQHRVHALAPSRIAWLHIVRGNATLRDVVLNTGDGVGIALERAVALTAQTETEILLFDLGAERAIGLAAPEVVARASARPPSTRDGRHLAPLHRFKSMETILHVD